MISENKAKNLVETTINELPKVEKEAGKVVLKVEGLYKKFCRNLKRSMIYGMSDLAKGFVGIPPKTDELRKDEFWALQDINFELRTNETLGIIGVNGAGKSTLLRVLTGIFPPDKGSVRIEGKVGGIIALGAGMHPHLTGKENVYLNGTILGLKKNTIDKLYDDIVSFAELGEFMDAPFSTYSSGMKVRLGFSVAVNVKPEVLLIDEVFSVGDIRFQAKCTRKIEELKATSSTIFISHSMRHINRVCSRVLLLEDGMIKMNASPSEVIAYYYEKHLTDDINSENLVFFNDSSLEEVQFTLLMDSVPVQKLFFEKPFDILLNVKSKEKISNILISYSIYNADGVCVSFINNEFQKAEINYGLNEFICSFPHLQLLPGKYTIKIKIQSLDSGLLHESDTSTISVIYTSESFRPVMGVYTEKYKWSFNYND